MKIIAAVLSAFVMFGVMSAAPANATHWKKHHAGKHYKHYKAYRHHRVHRPRHYRAWKVRKCAHRHR
jgi:hypothetical protein